jgi:hypothetical protein
MIRHETNNFTKIMDENTIHPRTCPFFFHSSYPSFFITVQKYFTTSYRRLHPTHKSSWYGASLFQLSNTMTLHSSANTWPSFTWVFVNAFLLVSGGLCPKTVTYILNRRLKLCNGCWLFKQKPHLNIYRHVHVSRDWKRASKQTNLYNVA